MTEALVPPKPKLLDSAGDAGVALLRHVRHHGSITLSRARLVEDQARGQHVGGAT